MNQMSSSTQKLPPFAERTTLDLLVQKAAEIIDKMAADTLTPDEAIRLWRYESDQIRKESHGRV